VLINMLEKATALMAVLFAAPLAQADTIAGQIVDINGVGIANGDVDAFDLVGEEEITLTGDSTDANGFFNITIPAGLYLLTFQGPPGSLFIDFEMTDVLVTGTVDFGMITLETGHFLSGRVLDESSFPVPFCDLDVFHGATGIPFNASGARTDLFGNFSILVPADILLHFDPRGVIGPTLAPLAMELVVTVDTNLGDITLVPGYATTGSVVDGLGNPVQGAKFEFTDEFGVEALTYNDSTDVNGGFDIVVAAGTWEIIICPPGAASMVGEELIGVVITGATDIGTTVSSRRRSPVRNDYRLDGRAGSGSRCGCEERCDGRKHHFVRGRYQWCGRLLGPGSSRDVRRILHCAERSGDQHGRRRCGPHAGRWSAHSMPAGQRRGP
jgi:hypothetical protein